MKSKATEEGTEGGGNSWLNLADQNSSRDEHPARRDGRRLNAKKAASFRDSLFYYLGITISYYCLLTIDNVCRDAESGYREHEDQTRIKNIIILDAYKRFFLTLSHDVYLTERLKLSSVF
jgi:hypothetical protein